MKTWDLVIQIWIKIQKKGGKIRNSWWASLARIVKNRRPFQKIFQPRGSERLWKWRSAGEQEKKAGYSRTGSKHTLHGNYCNWDLWFTLGLELDGKACGERREGGWHFPGMSCPGIIFEDLSQEWFALPYCALNPFFSDHGEGRVFKITPSKKL